MAKKSKLRVMLTVKLLVMFMIVVIISSLAVGIISYRNASKGLIQGVYTRIDAVSTDVVNKVVEINKRHFQTLHALAEMTVIKDENASLAEKQDQLTHIASSIAANCENVAFYDANGDAIVADGRIMNFKTRAYFSEAFAGKDYASDPTLSPITDTVLQHYSVPVRNNNGRIIGAIVMVISGNTIEDTIAAIDMGGGMHPSVINWATSTSVANLNENTETSEENGGAALDETQGLGLILNNIFAGKEGIDEFVDPNIHAHLLASYKRIPDTTWTVFAVAPFDMYFGSLKQLRSSVFLIIILTIIFASGFIIFFINLLIKPLKTVKSSIETIASGNADLTQRIPLATNDEIGDVVNGFNTFVAKLQGIVTNLQTSKKNLILVDSGLQETTQDASTSITEIIANIESVNKQILNQAGSVQETAGAVNEISANISSLERMIESQSASVTQASASVEQMIGNINAVNSSVGKMIQSFSTLQQHSQEGFNTQNNANEKIMRIEEQSKMLQEANIAIANIAEQTNLLAMNAAIEAAHAGEAGKGFAVVADEIRKLSETSTDQSKTIGNELQKISATIQEVVDVSNDTNTAFTAITNSIAETSQIVQQIKAAMEEQQIGSKQIIDALQSMNDSTSEVRYASEEMTEGNKHIQSEIDKLQMSTDSMKGSIDEMQIGIERMNATSAALSVIAGTVADNIKKIGGEIDLFKV
ncbi:methyl-accepting chemotaxis sensory transducer with Cache sensor [Treponema bryantii]|uniref:Methyl-accepting chemotaxis sensory transducer with Cache sensor n=1 Tax=Treponema bryantii TaxID=163 RepID=A0A1I3MNB6_9SPIR|nr:methyl-accepting chemotaxis protein [Treponema bryantii]SFI98473.1 methyl-accepting chemotaxis sensory transducer with Cache sensor [Treponema bryantii]